MVAIPFGKKALIYVKLLSKSPLMGRASAVVSVADYGPRGPWFETWPGAVRCGPKQVTLTHWLNLVARPDIMNEIVQQLFLNVTPWQFTISQNT